LPDSVVIALITVFLDVNWGQEFSAYARSSKR
jgi:hypothetical protein